ncbi:ABC-type transport system involved in resistance to organic solvents, auxiliary component [invertebrate metagenome]|uniref:ABC-type transport system involved in resistance to organic solvents, auxiliary component n=1 Tax=invertebrate metagenome TaxID=1711999 RepID=A0A484H6A7_9ZZZZ
MLGRHWRKTTEVERAQFLKLFEDITVYTWSKRFRDYSDQDLTLIRVRPDEGDTVVDSKISQPQGAPLLVLWRLRRSDNGIRITDLVVEGVSMAVTYRSEYSAVIRHLGSITGLLVALQAKRDELKSRN